MSLDLFSASILLILVLDPFGNLPLVVSALAKVPPERRVRVILHECLFAYVILLAFLAGGAHLSCVAATVRGLSVFAMLPFNDIFDLNFASNSRHSMR